MTSMLRAGRILSSDENNSVKQEQTTNVNIKVQANPKQDPSTQHSSANHHGGITAQHSVPLYPNISANPSMGFTIPTATGMDPSAYQSVQPTNSLTDHDTAALESEIAELTVKNKFLELMLAAYQQNPIKLNSYVIVHYQLLIEMVKLLANADKVDLILEDDHVVSCSCCNDDDHDELIHVSKILITVNGVTTDLKYSNNSVYSEFTKLGVSTKIVCK